MLKTLDDVKIDYSLEKIALQKRICGFAVLSPHNSFLSISDFAPAGTDFLADALLDDDKNEILAHLNSFSNKILLCEIGGKLCAFLPTLYPSSTLCFALVFDGKQLSTAQLLRLIETDECPDIFVISPSLKSRAARMSDGLLARGESFFELCGRLSAVLLDTGEPFNSGGQTCTSLLKLLLALSELVGCYVDSFEVDEDAKISSLVDIPLLLSFVITFMLTALKRTPLRSVGISLSELSGELLVKLSLECENEALGLPFVEWETIAADKNMFFEVYEENGSTYVSLQPIRRDWSYLGLKQKTEFI